MASGSIGIQFKGAMTMILGGSFSLLEIELTEPNIIEIEGKFISAYYLAL